MRPLPWPQRPHWLRRHRAKLLAALLLAPVVGLGGIFAYQLWTNWRQQKAIANTQSFLQRGDYAHAAVSLQRALRLGPITLETCRQAAELSEQVGSRDAVAWRAQAAALAPASVGDQCLLVKTALHFGDTALAEKTLAGIPPAARSQSEYLEAAGQVAWTQGRAQEAESHWAALLALEPNRPLYRLQDATAAILSDDRSKVASARQTLQELRRSPDFGAAALRVLIQDVRRGAAEERRTAELVSLADDLAHHPGAIWTDRLLVLDLWREIDPEKLPAALAEWQRQVASQPPAVARTISWMTGHNLAAEAIAWNKTLPPRTGDSPEVTFAVAEALIAQKDWPALQSHLDRASGSNWSQLEPTRALIQTHLWREQGRAREAEARLPALLTSIGGDVSQLGLLARLSRQWGWTGEAEPLWWAMAGTKEGAPEALAQLRLLYADARNTDGLYRVAQARYSRNGEEAETMSDLARLSFLTGRAPRGTRQAPVLAREAFQAKPKDVEVATTYALSLYEEGRAEEGLRILEAFSPAELNSPHIAGYYALLLTAAGQRARAEPYFARSETDPALLPEESALFTAARSRLGP